MTRHRPPPARGGHGKSTQTQAAGLFTEALAHHRAGRLDQAEALYRRFLALVPGHRGGTANLAGVLAAGGRPEPAVALYRALAEESDDAHAHYNLATALMRCDRWDQAEPAFRRTLALDPAHVPGLVNLAFFGARFGQLEAAETLGRRALRLQPEHREAHGNLAMVLLRAGRLAEGWREYEWRDGLTRLPGPAWRGEEVAGKVVLLYAEQGLGDSLQFMRYAPLVAARGARVVLRVQRPLIRLAASLVRLPGAGAITVVADDQPPPPHDLACPLMSLPGLFATDLATIPAEIPYLWPDAGEAEEWRRRLAGPPGLLVGLAWAGDPRPDNPRAAAIDRRRSLRLADFAPLAAVPGVSLVSLQKGAPAEQLRTPPPGLAVRDVMGEIGDFAGTAALAAGLDLVIAVDTSVAHLAGALGKPVWVLSRHDGCWRWLLERDDSPWYPTLRLYRQTRPGAWAEVIARVAADLAGLVALGR